MQTGAISFRVADFLKQYPPFQFMTQDDLLHLAAGGRVRFYEADEFLLWQGAAHSAHVPVIQQGTVSLLEENGGRETLRDIVGPGDLLALDRLSGAETSRYSAKSQSEVVVYALPAAEFDRLVAKYPEAARYIGAQAASNPAFTAADTSVSVYQARLADISSCRETISCQFRELIREVALRMAQADADSIAVLDGAGQFAGTLTARAVLQAIAKGDCGLDAPVESIVSGPAINLPAESSVSDAVLLMAETRSDTVAITQDGAAVRIISSADLGPSFGDQPSAIFRDIRNAPDARVLRAAQQRLHAMVLTQLASPAAVDWLARLAHLVSCAILERLMQLHPAPQGDYCWCYFGPAGRRESLAPTLPSSVLILRDSSAAKPFTDWHRAILEALQECGYLSIESPFDAAFCCVDINTWKERFAAWVRDPVLTEIYRARPLFDLRPVVTSALAQPLLWEELNAEALALIRGERDFLALLANDCLANLPPITFFRDLVVEESGEQADVFQLRQSALLPLVDVGRVFGFAAGEPLGASTLDRFAAAGKFLPEQAALFTEASETLRTVLALQARVGIRQRSAGFELPPALLSRYDRQVLKRGFRSILRLLEFTQHYQWADGT